MNQNNYIHKPAPVQSKGLPHQPSDIKPDEISEYEQVPPQIIITEKDHAHLPINRKVLPPSLLNSDLRLPHLPEKKLTASTPENKPGSDEDNQGKILDFARLTHQITLTDAIRITGLGKGSAKRLLKKLSKENKLKRFGRFTYAFYKPA